MISAERNPSNFAQVTLTFSGSFTEGTQYRLRVADVLDLAGNDLVTANRNFTYDTQSPQLLQALLLPSGQLELRFSESISAATAAVAANY